MDNRLMTAIDLYKKNPSGFLESVMRTEARRCDTMNL